MPIKYSCINDEKTLSIEYPAGDEYLKMAQILQNILAIVSLKEHKRQTIQDTDMNYHYITNSGKIFACVATKDVKQRVIFDFLDSIDSAIQAIMNDYNDKYMFRTILQQKMEFYNDASNDRVSQTFVQIDNVKIIIEENADNTIIKGNGNYQNNAYRSSTQTYEFEKKPKNLKRQFYTRNAKFFATIICTVLIKIFIILILECKPNCSNCN